MAPHRPEASRDVTVKKQRVAKQLYATCDPDLYWAMKRRAAAEGTSMRALIMQGLKSIGFDVPADDLDDRRK